MALDPIRNFAISTVATVPSPATTGTTLVLNAGDGALFPAATSGDFNVVIYPSGEQPSSTNAEIVRVTDRTTDTLTITREQEDTSARTVEEGDVVMLAVTQKVMEDIQDIADNAQDIIDSFAGGWVGAGETWTYASADDPTYTFTITGDKTTKYSAGMKIKLTQTTAKYFIITKVAYSSPNTTITMYGGTDYDLANAAITSPYYSTQKAPQGFPTSPAKWSILVVDTGARTQSTPSNGTWYNLGTTNRQISIPIGVWRVYYKTDVWGLATAGRIDLYCSLSAANNSESDKQFSVRVINSSLSLSGIPATASKTLTMATKATYYLVYKIAESTSPSHLASDGSGVSTIIEAVCSYL